MKNDCRFRSIIAILTQNGHMGEAELESYE